MVYFSREKVRLLFKIQKRKSAKVWRKKLKKEHSKKYILGSQSM
jgi:hypothetical protein